MRKISLVLVAAMLLCSNSIFANRFNDNPSKGLSEQISEILKINNFSNDEIDHSAEVRFTLNNKGEIVVMSVETESSKLESFVKSRLNYKKVSVDNVREGKLYKVSVRVDS